MHPFVKLDQRGHPRRIRHQPSQYRLYDHLLLGWLCWYIRFRPVLATLRMGRCGLDGNSFYRGFLAR